MGIGATELTKQAADIILTDDNFTSIIPALQEGEISLKFLSFQVEELTTTSRNFVCICSLVIPLVISEIYLPSNLRLEIWVMLIAISVGLPAPFTPIMILWANLVVDIPPSLALGIDNADPVFSPNFYQLILPTRKS